MATVQLKGFKELQDRINKAAKELPGEVDAELFLAVERMRDGAVNDAPADQGLLREGIQNVKNGELSHSLVSNAIYSAYQEFGTGSKVSIPAGLEEIAVQAKGGHISSLSAKDAIYAWAKRNGIEQRLWWPIFISIMVKGITPHPFFFKQLEAVQPELLKNIENILNSI